MEAEERQGQTTYGTIGFRSGTQLGGRIADPNISPNTMGVHMPRRLYACLVKTEVPD